MKTVIAQIVNFLVFVGVLYYLLYKPVGRVLRERREAEEADLRKAEELRAEAEKMRADAQRSAEELDAKREGILQEARDQADRDRKEVLHAAEEQARAKIERFRRLMKQERDELLENVTGELRETILHIANTIVNEDPRSHTDRAVARIEALLSNLSDEDMATVRKALAEDKRSVQVRSASPLDEEQQKHLGDMLTQKLGSDEIRLDVSEDPSLVAGLEIVVGHLCLAAHWRGVIDEALKAQTTQPVKGSEHTDS